MKKKRGPGKPLLTEIKKEQPKKKGMAHFMWGMHPAKLALMGYLSYIVLGWVLLASPISQREDGLKSLDALFIATSAVSTTGLATVSISDSFNWFGQSVVLLLIQLGGIGYMTFGSFVLLSRKAGLSDLRANIGHTVFSLPSSFRIDKFIRSVMVFTLVIELVGVIWLYVLFRQASMDHALWSAVFHSVSAFCTAGFSLYNNNLESFAGHFWINLVVSILSYLGAIGFIVCVDFWRMFTGKIHQVTLTSKIILWSTLWLALGGTVLLFVAEPSIRSMTPDKRLLAAFFQAMTAMTTVGFNTVSINGLSRASLLLIIVLMVIGASPSGTGGGIKSTTMSAVFGVMRAAIRGDKEVRFWGRLIPLERVWMAVASLGFYLMVLICGIYLLEMVENRSFDANFFEAVSALGTVGLSTGITATLTNLGKLIVIFLMFCGRIGPLTFGIALFCSGSCNTDVQDEDLAV